MRPGEAPPTDAAAGRRMTVSGDRASRPQAAWLLATLTDRTDAHPWRSSTGSRTCS